MKKIWLLLFLTILLALPVSGETSYSAFAEEVKPAVERTVDPEARDLYLKGRHFFDKWTAKDMETAKEYFEKAIEKDPNYALPYAILADSHLVLQYIDYARPKEVNPKAKEIVLKALDIDDTVGQAHGVLGWIKGVYEWDWAGGVEEYKQALKLNPTYIDDHRGFAFMLAYMGRFEEAIEIAEKGLAVDPRSPGMNQTYAFVINCSGKHEESMKHLQKSPEMFSDNPYMHISLGLAYLGQSMHEEALKEFQTQKGDIEADHYIGVAYALMGEKEKAKKVLIDLEEKSKETYIPSYFMWRLHSALGDQDKANEWLDRAYEDCDAWLCELKTDPLVDMLNLRSDPRYQGMLKKINLDK